MIIHCLSCGKSVSSYSERCPYCMSSITEMTLEANGIQNEEKLKGRVREMMFGLVHK